MKLLLFFLLIPFADAYADGNKVTRINTQVCIIGAGSGGVGAALAASRAGAQVVLIEKQGRVGGTSTMAFVNNWEPGPACSYAREIYNRIKITSSAIGISKTVHYYSNNEPYAISLLNPSGNYNQTLRRSDLPPSGTVLFDFEKFDETARQMLEETGNCKIFLNTSFTHATSSNKLVKTIKTVSATGEEFEISAKVFIDCTGNLDVCRDLGCETMLGADARTKFNEPSAPEKANNNLNAISLCYQIRKAYNPKLAQPGPEGTFNYHLVAILYDVPGKDNIKSINPLGIMDGTELIRLGYDSAYQLAKKIVDDHWAKLQKYPHFQGYEFDCYAPMLGIRESYRLVGKYVLNQNDLLAGYKKQTQNDIIVLADHPMDVHGKNSKLSTLKEPYGIPYRCLIPEGWSNLLVACRGASFSQLAASSCRLSRTMIALGHAAGFAASIAAKGDIPVDKVPIKRIQAEMNFKLRSKEDSNAEPLPISKTIGKTGYNLLFCDNGKDSIYQLSKSGEITWSYPAPNCQDIWELSNRNILFTYHHGEKGRGGVTEITKDKVMIFNYETDGEVHTCQRLENGNTLIGINNSASLIEVDRHGNILKAIRLKTNTKWHSAIRMARKLSNGNYLVCQEGDHIVAEYSVNGKLLKTFLSPGKCFEAIRLKNGNTLVSDGSACSIRELSNKGKVVWQISKNDFPELKMNWLAGIEILPNGNIIACNWLGDGKFGEGIPIFEISKEKKILFYYTDNVSTKSISNITLLQD